MSFPQLLDTVFAGVELSGDRQKAVRERVGRLDDERSFEPSDAMTADAVFMKQWAQALIANVLRQVSRWCDDRGRPDWFEIFSRHNFPPPGKRTMKKTALAAHFGLSRDQVRYAVDQVNEQFVILLRQEVADQVGTSADIDAEIRELESLLH